MPVKSERRRLSYVKQSPLCLCRGTGPHKQRQRKKGTKIKKEQDVLCSFWAVFLKGVGV